MRSLTIVAALYALFATSPPAKAQQKASKPPQAAVASSSATGGAADDESTLLKAAESNFDKEAAEADARLNRSATIAKSVVVDAPSDAPLKTAGTSEQSAASATRTEHASAPASSPAADLSARLGAVFDAPRPTGIPVRSVRPGTPAAAAALRPGDIIACLDGQKVHSLQQLQARLFGPRAGEHATLRVLHRGAARTVHVALAASPDSSIDSGRAQD